jgi:hypothetical protein
VDRDRALPLVLAIVAIVALALAAATLNSAVVTEGASGLGGDDRGVGDSRPDGGGTTGTGANGTERAVGAVPFAPCVPFLREPPVLAGYAVLMGLLFGAVYRSTRSSFAGLVVCGGVSVPVIVVWATFAICGPSPGTGSENATHGGRNGSLIPDGGAGGLGSAGVETLSAPTALLSLLVVIALAVVGVAVLASGPEDAPTDPATEPEPGTDADATERIGRLAGAAADRIAAEESVDADNEVYRAWRRMTEPLDVDAPATTTPREFERAAVEAGMARDDVATLTSLFEAVRYGGREATEASERRAVETLRRIEADYGGE